MGQTIEIDANDVRDAAKKVADFFKETKYAKTPGLGILMMGYLYCMMQAQHQDRVELVKTAFHDGFALAESDLSAEGDQNAN